MRTYSRADWEAAQLAWTEGRFSDEWRAVRHQAALRGIIYPPEGGRFDSWEDDEPSQRAMLIRAIRETPVLLEAAVSRAHSWGQVVAYVIARRDEWRAEYEAVDRELARRKADEPTEREATTALKAILNRIGDS